MKSIIPILMFLLFCFGTKAQIDLKYKDNKTVTYDEAIAYYSYLDKAYDNAKLITKGITDVGRPLHLFVISDDNDFDPVSIREKDKRIVLINNGIHPGEPCGVDASIMFAETVLKEKSWHTYLKNTVVCIIPAYNIGGMLNRSKYWRPQQPGPEECGFRGNAKNLDLNRDFIKTDTKNAKAITEIFHEWKPDVFLDTHTTNGSDHAYAITLLANNKCQYDGELGEFAKSVIERDLYKMMKETEYEMIPYINWVHSTPDNGIFEWYNNGDYSLGYGSLFNSISFITENHVYKPYYQRVESIYEFELNLLKTVHQHASEIRKYRQEALNETLSKKRYVLKYKLDSTRYDSFEFKGYKYIPKKNDVTGLMWREYDHDSVYTKTIPYYRYYREDIIIEKPEYYIIPQAWEEVIRRLKLNRVKMKSLQNDTILEVEVYYIENNKKAERQYNGHTANKEFEIRTEVQKIQYYKGDLFIRTDQEANNYIIHVLEPLSEASFFRWNFFDPILERREYLTANGFENEALEYLKEHPELKDKLEKAKSENEELAKDHYMQMWFIFSNSPYYEKTHNRYPVARLMKDIDLELYEE